ncbi:MAG: response regulator [Gemmatimonadales bacterium]
MVDVLEEAGHEIVATVPTGERALEHLQQAEIDVALLDIELKGSLSGIDVARVARGIPHVFITGSGDPATRVAAEATGPLGFLQKPFSREGLMTILDRAATHGNVSRSAVVPDGDWL